MQCAREEGVADRIVGCRLGQDALARNSALVEISCGGNGFEDRVSVPVERRRQVRRAGAEWDVEVGIARQSAIEPRARERNQLAGGSQSAAGDQDRVEFRHLLEPPAEVIELAAQLSELFFNGCEFVEHGGFGCRGMANGFGALFGGRFDFAT